ncbi:MAG: hypothetical protein R3223_12790 [Longimicrobiales bacterium]|nr:hypothetical protein [Longimicrobiales bacterium]
MRLQEKRAGRAVTFLFAVVFLTAAQGQALGLRHCSLHDALPVAGMLDRHDANSAAHGSPTASSPIHGEAHEHHHAAHEGEHSGAPGGCMDDCHVGATTVAGPVASVSTPSLYPSSGAVAPPAAPVGPRHQTYELHLPNAPPLSL